MGIDYDGWLETPYQRAEAEAQRRDDFESAIDEALGDDDRVIEHAIDFLSDRSEHAVELLLNDQAEFGSRCLAYVRKKAGERLIEDARDQAFEDSVDAGSYPLPLAEAFDIRPIRSSVPLLDQWPESALSTIASGLLSERS